MSVSIQSKTRSIFGHWLVRRWQDWQRRRRIMAELDCCDRKDAEQLPQHIGVSRADLRVLAGKWPDSLDLFSQRLREVKLDAKNIRQSALCPARFHALKAERADRSNSKAD